MKTQLTFSDIEYGKRKRVSRREVFLKKMDALIPWEELRAVIQPYYYEGTRGRPPREIEAMLRMYLLQIWYNLSDELTEDTIYDSCSMKEFARVDFLEGGAAGAATLLHFRHLLEGHRLRRRLFERINEVLEQQGMIRRGGGIVDAAVVEAPVSTKNSAKSRDAEMRQTKKGNERHFGMKAHIGAGAGAGMVHSVSFTAANAHDIQEAHQPVRADGRFVNGDAGYTGIERRKEIQEDEHLRGVEWRINQKKGKRREQEKALYHEVMDHLDYVAQPKWEEQIEYVKSKVRSKVEHNFYIIKHLFGYRKTGCRGLEKNGARLYMLFAMANVLRRSWRRDSLGALVVAA